MFNKLQAKWKVSGWQLLLILSTFAIGGSLTGYAGRKVLDLIDLERGVPYYFLYVALVTLLWPLAVLLVSIPLGQFNFFRNYIKRIFGRLKGKSHAQVVKEQEQPQTETRS